MSEDRSDIEPQELPPFVGEAARAIFRKLPSDKAGIVLGTGSETQDWKNKGWETLDIRTADNCQPDIVMNARNLDEIKQPNSQDYIVANYLPMGDESDTSGVMTTSRLTELGKKLLKPGGVLIINTGHNRNITEGTESYPLNSRSFSEARSILNNNGFETFYDVAKPQEFDNRGSKVVSRGAIYFARKPL